MENDKKYPCPVCGTLCLSEEIGSFDICPVCGWEDDYVSHRWEDMMGPNGDWTLNAARKAWGNGETLFERYPNKGIK